MGFTRENEKTKGYVSPLVLVLDFPSKSLLHDCLVTCLDMAGSAFDVQTMETADITALLELLQCLPRCPCFFLNPASNLLEHCTRIFHVKSPLRIVFCSIKRHVFYATSVVACQSRSSLKFSKTLVNCLIEKKYQQARSGFFIGFELDCDIIF